MLNWAKWNFRRLCEYYATFLLIKSILLGLATWFGFYSIPRGMDLPDFYSVTHMMQRTTLAEKHLSLFITMFFWYLLDSFKNKQTFCEFNVVYRLRKIFFPLYHNVVSCIYEFWWPWRVYFSPWHPSGIERLEENIVFMGDSLNVAKQTDVSKTCFS